MEKDINQNIIRDLFTEINKLSYDFYLHINIRIKNLFLSIIVFGFILTIYFKFIFILFGIWFLLYFIYQFINNKSIKEYKKTKNLYKIYFRDNYQLGKSYEDFLFYVRNDLNNETVDLKSVWKIYKNINKVAKLLKKQTKDLVYIKNYKEEKVFSNMKKYKKLKKQFLFEANNELKYFINDFYKNLKKWIENHKKELENLNKNLEKQIKFTDEKRKKAVLEISNFAILGQVSKLKQYGDKIKI